MSGMGLQLHTYILIYLLLYYVWIFFLSLIFQSLLQSAESDPGLSLLMTHLNHNLNMIFDSPTSMFLYTSVNKFLFEGVKFCNKPSGLAKAICKQIKSEGSKTIRSLQDGSLAFSLFNHVIFMKTKYFFVCLIIFNLRKMVQLKKYMKFTLEKVIFQN